MTTFNRPSIAELLAKADPPVREELGSVKRARELLKELDAMRVLLQWHIANPDRLLADDLMVELLGGLGQVLFMAAAENKTIRTRTGRMVRDTVDRRSRS